jgi:hypothetical protein
MEQNWESDRNLVDKFINHLIDTYCGIDDEVLLREVMYEDLYNTLMKQLLRITYLNKVIFELSFQLEDIVILYDTQYIKKPIPKYYDKLIGQSDELKYNKNVRRCFPNNNLLTDVHKFFKGTLFSS